MIDILIELKGFIIGFHILVAFLLVGVVLLQPGKGGGMGSAFGGGGQTLFGAGGAAPFLTKATTVLATLFVLTSVTLALVYKHETSRSAIADTPTPNKTATGSPGPTGPTGTAIPGSGTPAVTGTAVPSQEKAIKTAPAKKEEPAAQKATEAPKATTKP